MIKLFAFDLDGTLLMPNQQIDPDTAAFIQSMDIPYLLVTGRNYGLTKGVLEEYHLECDLILNNGHEFRSHDGLRRESFPFPKERGIEMVKLFLDNKFHLTIHGGDGKKYLFMDPQEFYQQHLQLSATVREKKVSDLQHSPLFSPEGYLHNAVQLHRLDQLDEIDILKLDARLLDKPRYLEILDYLRACEGVDVSAYWGAYVDICDNSMDKGKLLVKIAAERGISPDEIAVFGDADNDIPLFRQVAHSFAMGNAKEEVKLASTYQTASNEEQGVLLGMKKILRQYNGMTHL